MDAHDRRGGIVRAELDSLAQAIDASRSVVVTDPELRRLFGPAFPPCPVLEVPRGEAAKTLSGLERLYEGFARLGLARDGTVVAIGGGSVSDLAGFAASTWKRGVDFCVAPTTLLAMVDASLGGKNGVDFDGCKNLVGTFYPPRLVLCDPGLLASLPDSQFASGMAEAIKHAIIAGGEHFAFVERECRSRAAFGDATGEATGAATGAATGDATGEALGRARLARLIEISQAFKLSVVGRDDRESGERRVLNLGHTIGHAIEAASGLPHGHSVAAGMASAFRLAAARGGSSAAMRDAGRVARLLEGWCLPSSIEAARSLAAREASRDGASSALCGDYAAVGDADAFRTKVAAALDADKKRVGGDILFAMPYAIGDVRVEPVALGEIEDFVREAP